jgi:hypothetical protein
VASALVGDLHDDDTAMAMGETDGDETAATTSLQYSLSEISP